MCGFSAITPGSLFRVSALDVVRALRQATEDGQHPATYTEVARLLHVHRHGGNLRYMLGYVHELCDGDEGLCLPVQVVAQTEMRKASPMPSRGFFVAYAASFDPMPLVGDADRRSLVVRVRGAVARNYENMGRLEEAAGADGRARTWTCTYQ